MNNDKKSRFMFKVLLLGDPAVGKTSILVRYIDNKFDSDYISTIGVDFMCKTIQSQYGETTKITIWDIAGQSKYASYRGLYYKGTNFIIFVYDITNKKSLYNFPYWINDFNHNGGGKVNVAVIGNKIDLEIRRKINSEDYNNVIAPYKDRISFFIETSAKTGKNIKEAFDIISDEMINNCRC